MFHDAAPQFDEDTIDDALEDPTNLYVPPAPAAAAHPARLVYLVGIAPYSRGAHLVGPGLTRIGRGDVEIELGDQDISRLHAMLAWEDGWLVLTDADSGSGSWVNRRRVNRVRLENGDCLTFGRHRFLVVDEAALPSRPR